ncbi:MAG TPA: serine hydrolase [Thermomicrobiales bacterium]|nr:serine hydrolase [Thermomicrobiales bacterium]
MSVSVRSDRVARIIALLLALTAIAGIALPQAFAQNDAGTDPGIQPLAPPAGVTAKAVYVEDATSGATLYSLDPDARRSPASTTKLMTALVIANNTSDWQELVTADASDVLTAEDGESFMGLLDGDVLTVEQMMYGLMLPSGNDAAHAMARFIGGKLLAQEGATGDPYDRFIQEMNDTAADLGLQNTHFTNAAGLYDEEHYTSAHDLAVIAAHAYAVPEVATASGAKTYEFTSQGANPRVFTLANTNKLLGEDGVVAGKTGTLMESLACLVIVRYQGDNMIVGVLLGSDIDFGEDQIQIPETDHRFDDMGAILTDMDKQFRWVQPGDRDFPGLTQELAVWDVRLGDDNAVVLPAANSSSLRYLLQLGPPAQPDAPVGSLLIFSGDRMVAEKPVVQGGAA